MSERGCARWCGRWRVWALHTRVRECRPVNALSSGAAEEMTAYRPHGVNGRGGQRILVLSHLYPSRTRPTDGIFIHQSVQAMRALGVDARVLVPVPWAPPLVRSLPRWRKYRAIVAEQGPLDEVPVQRMVYPTGPYPIHVLGGLGLGLTLSGMIDQVRSDFPFDLIHAHTITPDGWAACLVRRRAGVPVVCSARGSDLNVYPERSRIVRLATRYVLRRSNALLAVSQALAAQAGRWAAESPTARVIYNGVDTSRFHPPADRASVRARLGLPGEARVLLFVGALLAEKGLRELTEAYARLRRKHKNLLLVLVGDGELLKWVRERLAEYGDAVRTPGRLRHDEVAVYCQASDYFVFPSYSEGMPNALLEAMSCGLPCVASSVGGIPEAIKDRRSGLLVPPRDHRALEAAIDQVLSNAAEAHALGEHAVRTIQSRFSWRAHAEAHVDVYRRVLDSFSAR